jgi:hypothetical protein
MKTFSEYACEKMMDLYNNHSNEVGSQLKKFDPVKYKDYESTDCITFSIKVLSYAFTQCDDKDAASEVWKLGKHGVDLAKYLVTSHRWKGIYFNPDSKHPVDANSEHPYSSQFASKTCTYYHIPLEYRVQNYATTSKTHPAFQKLNKKAPVTPLNTVDIASLDQVEFGFGVSKGGMHTWVFSKGNVYEVHWDKIGSDLYGATPLRVFPWLSGAIVVPPDQAIKLVASAQLKCGGQ